MKSIDSKYMAIPHIFYVLGEAYLLSSPCWPVGLTKLVDKKELLKIPKISLKWEVFEQEEQPHLGTGMSEF